MDCEQKRATKIIHVLKKKPDIERLKELSLFSLPERRLTDDLIIMYKYLQQDIISGT